MRGRFSDQGGLFSYVSPETRVPADHPLRGLDNVTLSPHLGYVSADTYRTFYQDTVEDVEAWLDGNPIRLLNPEALR